MIHRPKRIAVIGPGLASAEQRDTAHRVGEALARAGALLLCGGLGGVMEAAARGARRSSGTTIGFLPGAEASEANEWISIPIATGMGEARNVLLVSASQALVAIGGSAGTLSEIALAMKLGKPIVGLHTWTLEPPAGIPQAGFRQVHRESDPLRAVRWAIDQTDGKA